MVTPGAAVQWRSIKAERGPLIAVMDRSEFSDLSRSGRFAQARADHANGRPVIRVTLSSFSQKKQSTSGPMLVRHQQVCKFIDINT